jgi:hypothetical protein
MSSIHGLKETQIVFREAQLGSNQLLYITARIRRKRGRSILKRQQLPFLRKKKSAKERESDSDQ